MKKPGFSTSDNRTIQPSGKCKLDEYISPVNQITNGRPASLFQLNAQARLAEKEMDIAHKAGGPCDYMAAYQHHDIRRRYNLRYVMPGRSTYEKSRDGIV